VEAVSGEPVCKREFPVTREKAGNFSKNQAFQAMDVAENIGTSAP
jgi:hypothetical protein